jgi:hypothetical protein
MTHWSSSSEDRHVLMMVLVAGPYRSGTDDHPALIELMHPVGRMLAERCDAVLRIGGPSAGADEMVAIARANDKPAFYSVEEVVGTQAHSA